MCGIAAAFAYGPAAPPVDGAFLRTANDAMAARGPDGEGLWIEEGGRIGLAHRRLAIIDLSEAGAQPMSLKGRGEAAAGHTITFNGEIYNYQTLRRELEAQGHVFRSQTDTEVLLHLYDRHGPAMVDKLRGMYAFAIWDGKKQGLFLARDPFGIKPLYYADDGASFRAASQVRALLAGNVAGENGGHMDTSPDAAGHVGFFLWGFVPEPHTLYKGIRALPAGSTMWVDGKGTRSPETFFSIGDELRASENGGGEDLRELLRDSVRHHLVADVPVGLFLSSGLDSTTLAALASAQGGDLHTLTLGFEEYRGTVEDETPLADNVARLYGTRHETCFVRGADFRADHDRLLAVMDQPSIDGVNTYFVSQAAARAGMKVALSGLGGDELFGGYPSFRQIPRLVGLLKSLRPLPFLGKGFRILSAPLLRRLTSPKYASLLELGSGYGDAYLLRRGLFLPWELPSFLDADLVREGWRGLNMRARLEETAAGTLSPRAKVAALELTWYMRNQLLRDSDWAGMAHGLEIRVPLVDVDLFRGLAGRLNGATPPGKVDLAAVAQPPLPEAVRSRPKTGFCVPVRDWLAGEAGGKADTARGLRGWARRVHGALSPNFPGLAKT
ncbi:MAG: asparagine synthase (glutamine-hydrolyzing) [Alphaproteobacteria bacterium]|nr:asparagine synthase (glutamine-hydrolyzing) [Alphaproteobacteria bacterium]